ncbi:hypothetical protein DMENIID0001_045400 [Sergentomyia squamirostris]
MSSCSRGLKCCLNLNHVLVLFFMVCSLFLVNSLAVAKNVNHHHQDMGDTAEDSCSGVRSFFDTINITVPDRVTSESDHYEIDSISSQQQKRLEILRIFSDILCNCSREFDVSANVKNVSI